MQARNPAHSEIRFAGRTHLRACLIVAFAFQMLRAAAELQRPSDRLHVGVERVAFHHEPLDLAWGSEGLVLLMLWIGTVRVVPVPGDESEAVVR